jgi:hypothetical protein
MKEQSRKMPAHDGSAARDLKEYKEIYYKALASGKLSGGSQA